MNALTVDCPRMGCKGTVGRYCTTLRGHRRGGFHPARTELAHRVAQAERAKGPATERVVSGRRSGRTCIEVDGALVMTTGPVTETDRQTVADLAAWIRGDRSRWDDEGRDIR